MVLSGATLSEGSLAEQTIAGDLKSKLLEAAGAEQVQRLKILYGDANVDDACSLSILTHPSSGAELHFS